MFQVRVARGSRHELQKAGQGVHRCWPGFQLKVQCEVQELADARDHICSTLFGVFEALGDPVLLAKTLQLCCSLRL